MTKDGGGSGVLVNDLKEASERMLDSIHDYPFLGHDVSDETDSWIGRAVDSYYNRSHP